MDGITCCNGRSIIHLSRTTQLRQQRYSDSFVFYLIAFIDIRHAIASKYINPRPSDKLKYHSHLASIFEKIEGETDRKAEELPYQLELAEEYKKLLDCLKNLSLFVKLYTPTNKFDLFRYWRVIENHLRVSLSEFGLRIC